MVSPRSTRRYQQENDPFLRDHNTDLPTAYHGAGSNLEFPPTAQLNSNGFEDIQLSERPRSTLPTREGLGSRFLSSLSNAQPTAATLSRSGSVLHSRAKSWAANVSKLNTSNTAPQPQSGQKSKLFGDLFYGESARVQLGVPTSPTKEKADDTEFVMEYRPVLTERPTLQSRRAPTVLGPAPNSTSNNRKASWFVRKPSTSAAPVVKIEDDMLSLNINNSLFPHGPADPLSPQAFNDLLLNASNLLQRMQAAYKEKVEYIASVQPEIDAQKEEVEEANTRSEHLKMQLEDIGRQNQEQRRVNEELLAQLSQERLKLHEVQEASAKSVRLVRHDTETDDEGTQRRRKRDSSGTAASDSGFESDADTSSIFSSGMETPVSQRGGTSAPQVYVTMDHQRDPQVRYSPSRETNMSMQSTACSSVQNFPLRTGGGGGGEGGRTAAAAAAAWSTVEKLRNENYDLRVQMEDMQRNLQSCIELVESVGGM